MSTAESEIAVPDDEAEETALFRRAMALLAKSRQGILDATDMLEALSDKAKRKVNVMDANGEPTWTYLVKRPVPKDLYLTKKFSADAAEKGFTEESAKILMFGKDSYEGFIKYYQRVGTKWTHWSLVWQKWVRKERERKDQAQSGQRPAATRFDRQRTRS